MDTSAWTYGAEYEFGDYDSLEGVFPKGVYQTPERSVVNSNGIAADPLNLSYRYGGELNSPPTSTIEEQVSIFKEILERHPMCDANYRGGFHVHIRVPGLKDSLPLLKQIQRYIHDHRHVIEAMDVAPLPFDKLSRARARFHHNQHLTFLNPDRLNAQMNASSLEEFFQAEVPRSRAGQPLWHAQTRGAINLRQLLQTNTLEFRHYPSTTDAVAVHNAMTWCSDFLAAALDDSPPPAIPDRRPVLGVIYVDWQEQRWKVTSTHLNHRVGAEYNIKQILKWDLDFPDRREATPEEMGCIDASK